jgi:hypothetical protein
MSHRQRGITVFEAAVALGVIAVFACFLLNALLRAQEMAERTAVQMTVMNLRSALRLQMAHYVINGQEAELTTLVGANPIRWMSPPPGYLGELVDVKESETKPGSWYFDSGKRELVYRPNLDSELGRSHGGSHMLRWRIQAGSQSGMLRGINLVATEQISWFGTPMR